MPASEAAAGKAPASLTTAAGEVEHHDPGRRAATPAQNGRLERPPARGGAGFQALLSTLPADVRSRHNAVPPGPSLVLAKGRGVGGRAGVTGILKILLKRLVEGH